MSKGMSLEDWKKSLESDATKKLSDLEKLTESQKSKIKELEESKQYWIDTTNKQIKIIDQLCNRCHAQTHGFACLFCDLRVVCKNSPANQYIERWKKEDR